MPDSTPIKVTARLCSPLAGDAPHLDSLLEIAIVRRSPELHSSGREDAASPLDRKYPAPPPGILPIHLLRRNVGGWPVSCCSSPILGPAKDSVEHYCRRFPTEHADLLAKDQQTTIATTNGPNKSYRLPLRVRAVQSVVWFAVAVKSHSHGAMSTVRHLLKGVHYIGKKGAYGYGRVAEWVVEEWPEDLSWFARTEDGRNVLMRPLPASAVPDGTVGCRRDFGACVPPYWHGDRYSEIMVPC